MTMLALALTVVECAFILGIGLMYVVRPSAIASGFGFAEPPRLDDPFHRAKGIRDIATGLAGLAVLLTGAPVAIGALMLAFALVPLGDMLLVLGRRGRRRIALGVHGLTAVAVAGTAALWFTLV